MPDAAFPSGFLWGVATSAFQVEGATHADGRGESIWDRFCATPGTIADGSNGEVACDHYRRWRDDVRLLRSLGANAYRFSIAWPRVFPLGRGALNAKGLDFYDALVDELLGVGITPFPTLYHWDLPQALQDSGGWAERATVDAFADYADAVSRRLGDRVRQWTTHNEPWCIATLGHEHGEQAPGHRDAAESLRVAHHVLLSHGRAAEVLRRNVPGAEVGIVLILSPTSPHTASSADTDAARGADGAFNRWYLDPLFRGEYPADAIADRVRRGHLASATLPFVEPGDMRTISVPLDFLGVNYYGRTVVRAGDDGEPVAVRMAPPDELTDMGWEVYPQGLHHTLVRVNRDYGPRKIYVTENGAAYADGPDATGRVADTRRVDYLRSHLEAARASLLDGVPLCGYFAWSFLDNFEWAHGYTKRFGLVHVDYETQRRTVKDSARFYQRVATTRRIETPSPQPVLRRIP